MNDMSLQEMQRRMAGRRAEAVDEQPAPLAVESAPLATTPLEKETPATTAGAQSASALVVTSTMAPPLPEGKAAPAGRGTPLFDREAEKQFLLWRYNDGPAQVVFGDNWRGEQVEPSGFDALVDRVGNERFYFHTHELNESWADPTSHAKGRVTTAGLKHSSGCRFIPFDTDAEKYGKANSPVTGQSTAHYQNETARITNALQAGFAALGIKPSALWFSSRHGGGRQGLIRLDRIITPEKAKELTIKLAAVLGSDSTVHNPNRVLRVPGSNNPKNEFGRLPSIAELIELTDIVTPVEVLEAALAKAGAPALPVAQPKPSGLNAFVCATNYEPVAFDDPALAALDAETLALGRDGDVAGKYNAPGKHKRSGAAFAFAMKAISARLTPDKIAAIFVDSEWKISAPILEKTGSKRNREIERTIERATTALGKVASAIDAADRRRAATAAGVPIWRDCFDEAGLCPRPTLRNTVIAIEALGITCRLDVFHEAVLVECNGVSAQVQTLVGELTDHRLGAIRSFIDKRFGFDPGDHNVFSAVREIARDHAFHPIRDYLDEGQPKWDGVERIDSAPVTYFRAEDTALNRAQIRKALIASVRRIRQPGVKFDNIIVLESKEGTGKSTSVQILYGEENFSDQNLLGLQDREIQERLAGVWGFEISELAGMSRAEVERVKSQTTRTEDRARPAYGHVVEKRKRTCVLWASTNNQNYLKSQTGNRRFWPIAVGDIDLEALRRDRDQLWAEAATLESRGESLLLDKALWADAAEAQEQRREVDPWEDSLANIPQSVSYGIDGKPIQILFTQEVEGAGREIRVSSAALLTHILKIPTGLQHGAQATRLGTVMKRLGWQRPKGRSLRVNGTTVSGFFREDVLDPKVANSGSTESYGQAALALGCPEGGAP